MKAQELRIGNCIIFNDDCDRYGTVSFIEKTGGIYIDCNYKPDHSEDIVNNIGIHCDFIHPIPLTPEILEKAGFELKKITNIIRK